MSTVRHNRWLILLTGILALALVAYINRGQFVRGLVADSIYRKHIFTPPPVSPGTSRWHRLREEAQFFWDFSAIPIARERRLDLLNPTLRPLVKEIGRRQAAGEDMEYPMHIYREVRWRLNFTSDIAATQHRITELSQSLTRPAKEIRTADQQDPDGSWAPGLNVWYLKLYYSVDHVSQCRKTPKYPLTFLDRINSPEKLDAVLSTDLQDDFTRTGVFNREELDETFSALARMLVTNSRTGCYDFDPGLGDALAAFVNRWQNPATGYWGQWMVDRQGRVWKMDDMGMTFHVISDLNGHVNHLDQIAKRTLQLDQIDFPAGIRFNGHYEDHLNWDVVKIFREAWPALDEPTRQQARAEMSRMLTWCLAHSYQPDGSFKVSDLDDTPGDAYRYGVDFLAELGYFQRKDRFWTDQEFPESRAVHDRIEAKLRSMGTSDPGLKEAYDKLQAFD
jgi:hypothetical protein